MIGFDTLKAMESLRKSGFEEAQARAVVDTFKDAITDSVATKADVESSKTDLETAMAKMKADLEAAMAQLRADIEAAMAKLKADVETDMARLEARMQRFMFAMSVGIVGLNVTLTFGVLKFFL